VRGKWFAVALVGLACALLVAPDLVSASISRSRLRHGLANQMQSVGGGGSAWVSDMDAPGDNTLFSWASRTQRVLASNSKLFTTAATLDRFGAEGRLETTVYPRPKGAVDGRTLDGNLVLVGAGDPALASHGFASKHGLPLTPLSNLARQVRKAGIRRVTGDVRADDSIFDRHRGVPTTGVDASGELSPLSGLSYNSGFDHGHYAGNPELIAAHALKGRLQAIGVRVKGDIGRADLHAKALDEPPLAELNSPTMEQLIAATNKPSNNFFAEMLLKRLVARPSSPGTTRHGAKRVEKFANRLGTQVRMEDGSGLSVRNHASPRQVGKLLVAMNHQPDHRAYRVSLPLAGHEGTLAHRMNGSAADGRCRAKTGTLSGVSALSGYCHAGHGLVAFSILFNSVDVTRAMNAEDKMASLIAKYRP
jgi:D-alanyl-D-alanine carboxypeptidase/D-alanyl-D-alanine-endopeptidase (penicillin-binding protein 4)